MRTKQVQNRLALPGKQPLRNLIPINFTPKKHTIVKKQMAHYCFQVALKICVVHTWWIQFVTDLWAGGLLSDLILRGEVK